MSTTCTWHQMHRTKTTLSCIFLWAMIISPQRKEGLEAQTNNHNGLSLSSFNSLSQQCNAAFSFDPSRPFCIPVMRWCIIRLQNFGNRSSEFWVCKLIMSTYAAQIGAMHTQIITKPVTSPSKLDNNALSPSLTRSLSEALFRRSRIDPTNEEPFVLERGGINYQLSTHFVVGSEVCSGIRVHVELLCHKWRVRHFSPK